MRKTTYIIFVIGLTGVLASCGGGSSGSSHPSGNGSVQLGSSTIYCTTAVSATSSPGECYLEVLQWEPKTGSPAGSVANVNYRVYDNTGKVYKTGISEFNATQGFIVGGASGASTTGIDLGPNTNQVFYVSFTDASGTATFVLNQPK